MEKKILLEFFFFLVCDREELGSRTAEAIEMET